MLISASRRKNSFAFPRDFDIAFGGAHLRGFAAKLMVSHPLSKMEIGGVQRGLVPAVKGKSLLLAWVLQVLLDKYAASFVELINLAGEMESGRKGAHRERMRG